jgi:hypothetical protein
MRATDMDTSDTFDFGLFDIPDIGEEVVEARKTYIDPAVGEDVVTFLQMVETNPGDIGDKIGLVIDPAESIHIGEFIDAITLLPGPTAPPETSLTFSDDFLL